MAEVIPSPSIHVITDEPNATSVVNVAGCWTVKGLPLSQRISTQPLPARMCRVLINGTAIEELDASGAWLLVKAISTMNASKVQVDWLGFSASQLKLIQMIEHLDYTAADKHKKNFAYDAIRNLGQAVSDSGKEWQKILAFFGQFCVILLKSLSAPQRLRVKSIIYHANHVGINAIPIVIILAISISVVLGYQGANQLKPFGAMSFTINLVAISMLREMGVLITAIMASGRSCSSFAAQLGVMQMNDEVAAMRTLGLDPMELLVLPRVLGMIIALPALTVVADGAGLFGTFMVASLYLDMSYTQFMARLQPAISDMTIYIGLMKAPVFAMIIGIIGCYQGLQVRSSATELGQRTTTAVVQSIFLIVIMDALFSVIFTLMGI